MRYPAELSRRADDILADRRLRAGIEQDRRLEEIRTKHPEIQKLRVELYDASIRYSRCIAFLDGNSVELLKNVRTRSQALTAALLENGYPPTYFEYPAECGECQDKGFFGGAPCKCREQLLRQLAFEMLADGSRIRDSTFDSFDLEYYPADIRPKMERLLTNCRRYAEGFDKERPNLLFTGPTGLGKTHLSLAIAGRVVEQGLLVIYASAGRMLERLGDIVMGDTKDWEYRDLVYGCDLLVVDDLGTEFHTRFTPTEFYSLVNTRINERRPTILNTNLTMAELEKPYSDRVVSRLAGCYSIHQFSGTDIRFQKRRETYDQVKKAHE